MAMKTLVKCNCGQRIVAKDVMQTGYYLRLSGPNFVYVKFRCSRCKKLGEQFVKQEDWEGGILRDVPNELSDHERQRFGRLGPISVNEVIEAHFLMETSPSLGALMSEAEMNVKAEGEEKA